MCLCSDIQHVFTESSDKQELKGRLEEFLTLLYDFISSNKHLVPQLPFTLQKRTSSLPRTLSERPKPSGTLSERPKPSGVEKEKRIAKIYDYDPTDYNVRTLLHNHFEIWDKQPWSFFGYKQAQLNCDVIDPQSTIILNCLQLQQLEAHSRILRRFHCVALHRCRAIRHQNDDAKTIARAIFPLYHSDKPLEEADDDLQVLTNSIETLIQAGPRYENIAKKLGFGSLFLLGDVVPTSVWERSLPKKGPLFEQAMTHLIDKNIINLGKDYENLAKKILKVFEDGLPKNPCIWINQDVMGQQTRKRRRQSPKPKLGRQPVSTKKSRLCYAVKDTFNGSEGGTEGEHQQVASDTRVSIMDQRDQTLLALVPAESDTTESQQLLEQEESQRIPEEFMDDRPFTGQEESQRIPEEFMDGRPFIGQEEGWSIPEEFMDGRPFIGQEEGWSISEEFMDGRPFIGQEEGWSISEEFMDGRPFIGQEEGWSISEEFMDGRPFIGQEEGWSISEEFMDGRPFIGQEEGWSIPEEFMDGRLFTPQE
ncbi:hypothetical protein OCU04_004409 [Sclerotinia nivalis]|uniref:Uncharacterized protein n=1 Tax=Sclerotinia nivalis TaxID=352851 RepID=A0A9X0AR72_9HELO|nr:hypothetical protein OCU04_004409 [Sclerotinia nivalis]